MKFVLLALMGVAAVSAFAVRDAEKLSGQELVDYINKVQTSYKAKLSPLTKEQMKSRLMEVKYTKMNEPRAEEIQILADIPATFDARQQWPNCPSIDVIRDQSDCGSCWAFGASEAMSDRVCIGSNGAKTPLISADDLLSCCGISCGYGCSGGYPIQAWRYWVKSGLVTGGLYGDTTTCRPYEISPCGHHPNQTFYRDCPATEDPTPKCTQSCSAGYPKTYPNDKIFGKSAYAVGTTVAAIQKEILTNGPVEAAYTVYEDFYHYTTGVYIHTSGAELGGHAVRILGWGNDGKTDYWLVANSWNTDWGENGYFRIRRGTDECGIEDAIVAGLAA